jgi:hypothetical protein
MSVAEKRAGMSEAELEQRMLAVDNAIAQQELEGLTVSPETVHDLRSAARREITIEQIIENIHDRLKHVSILR